MKVNILTAALTIMMAMAACTNEVIESSGNNDLTLGQGEDVIRISLSNTTATRAVRPIGSSEALNNVNRIAFKFLTDGTTENSAITLEGVINETSGETVSGYEVVSGNVLQLPSTYDGSNICVKFSGMTAGSYRIIAYGYNYTSGTDGSDAFPYSSIELASDKGSNKLYKVTGVATVQEIFAGCNGDTFIGVNEFGKFETVPTITLTRQVAGLLAYFEKAPVYVNNTKVAKVTVSGKAAVTGFYMPALLLDESSYNGINTSGWNGSVWVNYLTFDMTKADNYSDPYLDNGDTYTFDKQDGDFLLSDETTAATGLLCNKNTLFGSRFMLAYPNHYDSSVKDPKCATLNICYWDADEKLILSVPLRNGGNDDDSFTSATYQYDILCNNFYSIGKKTDVEGDDNKDTPIDIQETTGYDYANVSITSDWTDVHDLVN